MSCTNEVSLHEVLDARENRASFQREMIAKYNCALICFMVNMPGPIKLNDDSILIHAQGVQAIHDFLAETGMHCQHEQIINKKTGMEGYFLLHLPPLDMKQITCKIEDTHPLGRLFDIDVIGSDARPISRDQIGLSKRKCFLCGNDGVYCSRNQTHSVPELQQKIKGMISEISER